MGNAGDRPFTMRPMTVDDLPAAREFWTGSSGIELAEGDGPDDLAAYLLRNPDSSLVAESGGQLIGAVLAGHDGRRGFLYHLAVASGHRGAGVGRQLVQRCLSSLRASGIARVIVLVARDNEGGILFWEKNGYEALSLAVPMGIDL